MATSPTPATGRLTYEVIVSNGKRFKSGEEISYPEDPPPLHLRQRPANNRPHRRAQRRRPNNRAQVWPAIARRDNITYNNIRQHIQPGRSGTLNGATRNQHGHVPRAAGDATM